MQLHYTGPELDLEEHDLKLLETIRECFEKRHGDVLSWKFDLAPLTKKKQYRGLNNTLLRLWKNGYVVRFAKQFYSNYDQLPEYIQWYIWEDVDEGSNIERGDPRAAHYIVQG